MSMEHPDLLTPCGLQWFDDDGCPNFASGDHECNLGSISHEEHTCICGATVWEIELGR